MANQTKRQAAYHGEIGANGKAYQKGQFIAEQKEYQNTATKSKKGTGKQEIEPYVWEVPLDSEMRSIFKFLAGIYAKYNHKAKTFEAASSLDKVCTFQNESPIKVVSLIERFNAGERWYYPNQEVYI